MKNTKGTPKKKPVDADMEEIDWGLIVANLIFGGLLLFCYVNALVVKHSDPADYESLMRLMLNCIALIAVTRVVLWFFWFRAWRLLRELLSPSRFKALKITAIIDERNHRLLLQLLGFQKHV